MRRDEAGNTCSSFSLTCVCCHRQRRKSGWCSIQGWAGLPSWCPGQGRGSLWMDRDSPPKMSLLRFWGASKCPPNGWTLLDKDKSWAAVQRLASFCQLWGSTPALPAKPLLVHSASLPKATGSFNQDWGCPGQQISASRQTRMVLDRGRQHFGGSWSKVGRLTSPSFTIAAGVEGRKAKVSLSKRFHQ